MSDPLGPRHSGHDYGAANLDAVGKAYIVFASLWTMVVMAGLTVLLMYRRLDFVRMRNTTLVASAVLTIHVYLVLAILLYPVNGAWPCDLEFWIMSVYFPLGIALFQAQNMQLLSLSCRQKKLIVRPLDRPRRSAARKFDLGGLRKRWQDMSLIMRTFTCIIIGAFVLFITAIVIFFLSRKFHSSFGVVSKPSDPASCRSGWEWTPSVIWQFFWTYIFGPVVLFKIRKIRDIHRWRQQTSLAIIASLPGPALWLAAVYSPKFARVNNYWPPAMWFAPGLITMESVMVFFPLLEVYQSSKSRQTTMTAIEEWEKNRHVLESVESNSTRLPSSVVDSESNRRSERYNMQALERALEVNHSDLLEYAATREFTGENILFLTRIRDWKDAWARAASPLGVLSLEATRQLFDEACDIFASSISLQTAQFPINIESKIYFALHALLGSDPPSSPSSVVTPFASSSLHGIRKTGTSTPNVCTVSHEPKQDYGFSSMGVAGTAPTPFCASLAVPHGFDGHVFDRAERSVKYMVFTNTWIRYMNALEDGSRTSLSS